MKKIISVLLFLLILIGLPTVFVLTLQYKINPHFADWQFCEDNGYGYQVDTDGHYTPYKNADYGRVKCYYCYADGCEGENFNVTRDWRNKLFVKGEVSE